MRRDSTIVEEPKGVDDWFLDSESVAVFEAAPSEAVAVSSIAGVPFVSSPNPGGGAVCALVVLINKALMMMVAARAIVNRGNNCMFIAHSF